MNTTANILLNDFKAEPEALIQEQLAAVEQVIRSGWYVLGKEVKSFETEWAKRCGTAFAVGLGNGMDAAEIGLRALNIGPGDEVITTPMTAFATVLAILRAGAVPVLADIEPETALLSISSVERCLSKQTKAVLLVHLYGQIRDMDAWNQFCEGHHVHLVEDCAQAHLAVWEGKAAGTFGEWGAYSFYPTKNLGALGDGGALITHSEEIAHQASMLRNYGQSQRYHHPEIGLNSRLDEIQAAMLSVRLGWLDTFTTRRREIAEAYLADIDNPKICLLSKPHRMENHVYHLFVVRCQERDRLADFLQEQGISSLIHYPVNVHHQIPCNQVRRDPQGLPYAEEHANTCLTLPCHPQMSNTDVARVIKAVNEFH
jgi:dTDP-4-amino-4,6-dideoxygalactose transaminase